MSFADHGSIARDSTQRKTNGSHENSSNGGGSNMDQISEELSELKRNIERFENQKRRIPSDEYQKFLKDNMDLYSKLNDILKSEMKRSNQQNQNYLLKFEKILNEQSKKLKAVSLQMKRAVEEESNSTFSAVTSISLYFVQRPTRIALYQTMKKRHLSKTLPQICMRRALWRERRRSKMCTVELAQSVIYIERLEKLLLSKR
eukprot:TRINITY_DN2539_c0_g1_i2.p1 TRINITY_DN2539_c0_g1~~TRINITY_DN2539_c0_g1_i2.p1  ORF type:complete len:202 (-),score=26.83 TRINITY_DN2539_c0_g1_i2:270-875(-)